MQTFYCNRVLSTESHKQKGPPVRFFKVRPGHEYRFIDGKHKCTFCEDKEKSLVEQVEAEARRPKLSLSYEPCIMKVHQSIGLEILKFCLDSVLSDKVEKLSFKETQEDILRCMKNDLLVSVPRFPFFFPLVYLRS